MKLVKIGVWLLAAMAALAAGLWASGASQLPESSAARQALGEVTFRWSFTQWCDFAAEPAHVIPRLLHLGLLQVPGMSISGTAFANAILAVLLAWGLVGLLRRTFAVSGPARAWAFLVAALFACSPAFGADWLHGERSGLFLPPLLLVWSLSVLAGDGGLGWRVSVALLFAVLAPFCHDHGMLVCLAVVPALREATHRAGSQRGVTLLVVWLVVGLAAAVASLVSVSHFGAGEASLVARLAANPLPTLDWLLGATGRLWGDPLPGTTHDQTVLGACTWLLPIGLWWLGDRSAAARRAAAPWWSCWAFGLLILLWNAEWHGLDLDSALQRELGYGAFCAPLGCLGVLAARFGPAMLPLGAGACLVLGLQGWQAGLEDLRLARMRIESEVTRLLVPKAIAASLPPAVAPVVDPGDWLRLQERGWVPLGAENLVDDLTAAIHRTASPAQGGIAGVSADGARGLVRSSLLGDTVQCVVVMVVAGDKQPRIVGITQPNFAGLGRDVPWSVTFATPLAEGAHVRVLGVLGRSLGVVALGSQYVLRSGTFVEVAGS